MVALFLTPFMLRHVSKEEYGLYVLCVELFSWISFMNLGTAKVLGPKVSKELALNNRKEIVYLFNSSFWFQLGVSVLVIPLYFGLVKMAGVEEVRIEHLTESILLFSLAAFMNNLSGQFSEMIIATRKIHLDNKIQIAVLILRAVLIISFVPIFGMPTVFIVYFLIAFLDLVRKVIRVNQLYPGLSIKISHFSKLHFNKLISQGVFFSLASVTTILVTKFDSFFLGKEFGLEMVSSYYVSIKLIQIGEKGINVLFNNFRPYISRLYGQRKVEMLSQVYIESTFIMLIITSIFVLILTSINEYFVTYWVGENMYLSNRFNTLVVLFYALNLMTLPSRILLVSTLSYIPNLTISGFFQGVSRFLLLYFGFGFFGIDSLPISNIISLFFVSFTYQMYLLSAFFSKRADIAITNAIIFVGFICCIAAVHWQMWAATCTFTLLFCSLLVSTKINFRKSAVLELFERRD